MDKNQSAYECFRVPDPGRIRKVESFVLQQIHRRKKDRTLLLECGVCGGGLAERMATVSGVRCWGIDINARTVPGVQVVQADVNDGIPPLDGESFDFIFAGEFMEHLYDDALFIRRCYDRLAPDGYLILSVPNLHYMLNRFIVFGGGTPLFVFAPGHYHVYTRKTVVELVRNAGLQLETVRSSHVLFPAVTPAVSLPRFIQYPLGNIFELMGDWFPTFGAHLLVFARKGAR
jgi:2-polyprenyl-3-methyl-5-hydroxy-6-metoxy-1,4-benzoquinol methylase